MRSLFVSVFVGVLVAASTSAAEAKCYHFRDTPSDVYVCVGKDGSDSFADRKKGKKILQDAGETPSTVSSSSSSCHSNAGNCYDENGKKHRSLKGY